MPELNPRRQYTGCVNLAAELTGVWTLRACVEERDGREDAYPFGAPPEGFLIYTAGGFVSAQLMKPGRARFASGDWRAGTPEEFVESGSGYLAYCGTYEVDEAKGTVTHLPGVALMPNMIGAPQVRLVTLNGNELTLRTPRVALVDAGFAVTRLEWRRAAR